MLTRVPHSLLIVTLLAPVAAAEPPPPAAAARSLAVEPGRQVERQFKFASDEGGADAQTTISYLLFVPKEYDERAQRWPLLLFLHGLGESGDGNLDLVKKHGPPKLVEKRADFPFVVVSPQSPRPERGRYRQAWKADSLIRLVDHVAEGLHVDDARIYVTGLSMGGFGTWRLAASYPERFAAAVPICGGGDVATAPRLKGLPIWCFHGEKDRVVPPDESRKMVDAVRAAGGDVELTIYPNAGHDSWTATYDNQDIYDWLLARRRGQAPPQ